jgi:hypothetical protein
MFGLKVPLIVYLWDMLTPVVTTLLVLFIVLITMDDQPSTPTTMIEPTNNPPESSTSTLTTTMETDDGTYDNWILFNPENKELKLLKKVPDTTKPTVQYTTTQYPGCITTEPYNGTFENWILVNPRNFNDMRSVLWEAPIIQETRNAIVPVAGGIIASCPTAGGVKRPTRKRKPIDYIDVNPKLKTYQRKRKRKH